MRTSRRNKKGIKTDKINLFAFIMAVGSVLGCGFGIYLRRKNINDSLNLSFGSFFKQINGIDTFLLLLFSLIKVPVAIWFSAFSKIGKAVIVFLLLIKAMALGFSFFALGISFGLKGVAYAIGGIGLSSFILIFTYIYLAMIGFKYIEKKLLFKEYFICLAFAITLVLIAVSIEIVLAPISIGFMG